MPNTKQGTNKKIDFILVIIVLVLVVVGLIIMYSTSAYNGQNKFHDSYYYVKKQFLATALGLMGMFLVANIDFHIWVRYAVGIYLVAVLFSLAVVFVGDEYNGSKRWLSLGPFSFQPSEFAKVAVLIFLSYLILKFYRRISKAHIMGIVMCAILPMVGLVGMSNLSTAIIILGIAVVMIFVATPKYMQFIGLGIGSIVFLGAFLTLESYRMQRIAIWRNPEEYEKGYQTLQGLYAIGSGGLFGKGLGNSIQKLGFVPEAKNDMIFSIICEELGGALIVSGAMAHMVIQVILNVAVVTNTIPNTGITLPFISYGGTSVMFLLIEIGVVLNISSLGE